MGRQQAFFWRSAWFSFLQSIFNQNGGKRHNFRTMYVRCRTFKTMALFTTVTYAEDKRIERQWLISFPQQKKLDRIDHLDCSMFRIIRMHACEPKSYHKTQLERAYDILLVYLGMGIAHFFECHYTNCNTGAVIIVLWDLHCISFNAHIAKLRYLPVMWQ